MCDASATEIFTSELDLAPAILSTMGEEGLDISVLSPSHQGSVGRIDGTAES